MIAKHVFYEGRVQGVGFRYTVRHLATGYEVIGWVRNMPDGRVEMLAGGQSEEVTGFLDAIVESELAGFIKNQQVHSVDVTALAGLNGFSILP